MQAIITYTSYCLYVKDMLWISGGWNGQQRSLKSSEFVGSTGVRTRGPDLPMALYGHCVVKLSSFQVMVIGNLTNAIFSFYRL